MIRTRDYIFAQLLIDHGADVNSKSEDGTPILHTASSPEIIRVLLAAGANVNATDRHGKSVLHYASSLDDAKRLEELDADVNAQDDEGFTLLHQTTSPEMLQYLLGSGANPNIRDSYGDVALHTHCASRPPPEAILQLVYTHIEAGVDANIKGYRRNTALHYASGFNGSDTKSFFEVAELLLQRGCDVNAKNEDSETVLLQAMSFDAFKLFLKHGADASVTNKQGQTIWHLLQAAPGFYLDWADKIMQILIKQPGIDLNVRDAEGRTPLSIHAEFLGLPHVRRLLKQASVDTNAKDNFGRTPFSRIFNVKSCRKYASTRTAKDYLNVMELFSQKPGVLLDEPDLTGRTPISYASECPYVKTLQRLKQKGIFDWDSRDALGRTPLSYAAEFGREPNVHFLLQQGARHDRVDNSGMLPFHYALASENSKVIETFIWHYLHRYRGFLDPAEGSPNVSPQTLSPNYADDKLLGGVTEKEGSLSGALFESFTFSMLNISGPQYEDSARHQITRVKRQYLKDHEDMYVTVEEVSNP